MRGTSFFFFTIQSLPEDLQIFNHFTGQYEQDESTKKKLEIDS